MSRGLLMDNEPSTPQSFCRHYYPALAARFFKTLSPFINLFTKNPKTPNMITATRTFFTDRFFSVSLL